MLSDIELCIYCCKKDNLRILKRELNKGTKIKDKIPEITLIDYHSQTFSLLHICTSYGAINCLKYLIEKGMDPNQKNNNNWAPIHFACRHGHAQIVRELLTHNIEINCATIEGYTPIELASWFGQLEIVEKLYNSGADINNTDNYKCSPLHRACQCSYNPIIKFLLESGANPSIPNLENPPLFIACITGDLNTIDDLIRCGADVNTIYKGKTAILIAIQNYRIGVLKLLIEKGANIELSDSLGNTPLHMSTWLNQLSAVENLINNGANVNSQNILLETPLHKAAEIGSCTVAKLLLDNGADIELKDKIKRTARDWAKYMNHISVLNLIDNYKKEDK